MPADALAREQSTAHAREQIRLAETLLAAHRRVDDVTCTCGRSLPCPHARSLAAARDRYRQQLWPDERTQLLPVINAAA